MRRPSLLPLSLLLAGGLCQAQWEIGAFGGFAKDIGVKVENSSISADAGFKPAPIVGVRAGQTINRLGGEVTYLYRFGAAQLKGNGQTAEFDAEQHLITADFLWHFNDKEAKVRPFLVFGGGARVIRGIGVEHAYQPLSQLAVLTKTTEVNYTGDVGLGVKVRFGKIYHFRAEFRDYIGPGSAEVIAISPGAKKTGVLNDLMGLVGISFIF